MAEMQVQARMLNWSRVRRKLVGAAGSMGELPRHALQRQFGAFHYDATLGRLRRIHNGSQPEAKKIAIYVIYPQDGLKPSHTASIKYILRSGYSPVVVSNLELNDKQRNHLLELSWLLIERPNIGQDIGGYRDAILDLDLQHQETERLALFNDSCWFPVPSDSDWLAKAEALDRDLVGSMSSGHIRRRHARRLEGFQWSYNEDFGRFHYCSYALLLSGRVVRNPDFTRYWRRYPLFNDRRQVIERGEIGITRWIKRHNYSHGSTVGIRGLNEELEGMTNPELCSLLETAALPWSCELVAIKAKLQNDYKETEEWKHRVVPYLLFAAYRGPACYSFPEHLIHRHDFGFLKKATARSNEDSAKVMKCVAQRLDARCDFDLHIEVAEIAAEIGA